ncbi:hypothetical protein TRFO_41455 [Tritrichomonas foetus]|uniref:SPIN90/Ldb17 leucine-rich domain-containing protein n=1 Tax=Tritrichomonas foetus TaxID=1144522 RepID=A0A1J4L074_9EUKA|nr:hypothetical protein TRFO_41455 [Tritrichomonas foetus]|eukprot:OHT16903.1 hypothetical protein TRFO_41455 [Tritrichomonas foetus]
MNLSSDIRRDNRIVLSSHINTSDQSSFEYHQIADSIFQSSNDEQLFYALKDLFKHYSSLKSSVPEDEYLIVEYLLSRFLPSLPIALFDLITNVICIIIHKNGKDCHKYKSIFRDFISNSIPLITESHSGTRKNILLIISHLTSISAKFSRMAFRFFTDSCFLVSLLDFTDHPDAPSCRKHMSHILMNALLVENSAIIANKTGFLDTFFHILEIICENGYLYTLPDLITCVRHIIVKEPECYSVCGNFIDHFNQVLLFDNESAKINTLLILREFIVRKIRIEEIDMLTILQMMEPGTKTLFYAIRVVSSFIQQSPQSVEVFCHMGIISITLNVLQNGDFDSKIQTLNIILSVVHNAANGDLIDLIEKPFISPMIEMATDVPDPVLNLIFHILQQLVDISVRNHLIENVRPQFQTVESLSIIENLANRDDSIGESANRLLRSLEQV